MPQAKFNLTESQIAFLQRYRSWGFSDKSALVREALDEMKAKLARERRVESAKLYAEIYAEDKETQGLADAAIKNWPR